MFDCVFFFSFYLITYDSTLMQQQQRFRHCVIVLPINKHKTVYTHDIEIIAWNRSIGTNKYSEEKDNTLLYFRIA